MILMLKQIFASLLLLTFVACGNDGNDEGPMQSDMPEQMPGQPQQDPMVDTDVSDEELNEFVDALTQAQEVQAEAQMEMLEVVENEELEVDTYNQIAQALQLGQTVEDLDIDEEDMQKFENASAEIVEIEQEMEGKLSEAIESEGMSMERFEEINMAIQQDPALQQRVQQMIMPEMEQAPQQQQPTN